MNKTNYLNIDSSTELPVKAAGSGYRGLTVIIPTRNRAGLAIRAIKSCLNAPADKKIDVLVSDNSTDEEEIRRLRRFCDRLNDFRVSYVRPPKPLAMHKHWEWVFDLSLDKSDVSHLTVLPDRRVLRNGATSDLVKCLENHPNVLLLYRGIPLIDFRLPVKVERSTWSGKLLKFDTRDVLLGASRSQGYFLMIPTPMLCCIPRRVFQAVRARFGSYCDSAAADFCFGFRALGVEDTVLLYDKVLQISASLDRSTGVGVNRGLLTKDVADYFANLEGHKVCGVSPISEIVTGQNAMVSEYCKAKQQSGSDKFPEVDMEKYIDFIRNSFADLEDTEAKSRYLAILESRNTNEEKEIAPPLQEWRFLPTEESRRSFSDRIKGFLSHERTKPFWFHLATRFGVRPPNWMEFDFPTSEMAVRFAQRYPDPNVSDLRHLARELRGIPFEEITSN